MTKTTTETKSEKLARLQREAAELSARTIAVETNAGTFGAHECCAAVGSGDPRYGTYTVYQRIGDGKQFREGCPKDKAPGYARYINAHELTAARKELRALRQQISRLT